MKRAKKQAEASARLKTSIISNINHEFRTPLAAILGYAEILHEEVGGVQQEFTEYIRQNGQRLRDTLDAMLDLSRFEASKSKLTLERLDLNQAAQETVQPMAHLAEKKGVSLQVVTEDNAVYAMLDPAAAQTVLRHLVSNAIKFTEHGEVTVTVERQHDAVCLSVRDTGIGIGEAFLPELFEAFKQESTGVARLHEGSGLGLALTRRLVEAMNGRIEVETERGVGTTFHVYFPTIAAGRHATPAHQTRADHPPVGNVSAPQALIPQTSGASALS